MKLFRVKNEQENPISCVKCGENDFNIPKISKYEMTIIEPSAPLQTKCNICGNIKSYRYTNDKILVKQ